MVADERRDVAWFLASVINFFRVESCGKCTPCREGTVRAGVRSMLLYEFQCRNCGHQFEVFASFSQKEKGLKPSWPKCESQDVSQVFNGIDFFAKSGKMPFDSGRGGCCSVKH